MSLASALDTALKLKAALNTEVSRSKDARSVLRSMDPKTLFEQASLREAFNEHSTWLSAELTRAFQDVADDLGQPDITLSDIRVAYPFEGEQLCGVFGEIRALSAALKELDELNQLLAEKALTFVRAYVTHLAPPPSAYTRRGALTESASATHSERA
jgi:hypothetical protein